MTNSRLTNLCKLNSIMYFWSFDLIKKISWLTLNFTKHLNLVLFNDHNDVLWPILIKWAKTKGPDADKTLVELSARLADQFATGSDTFFLDPALYSHLIDEVAKVAEIIREFDSEHADDATFNLWRNYMHLVSILLRFTRALREGDWDLYLYLTM